MSDYADVLLTFALESVLCDLLVDGDVVTQKAPNDPSDVRDTCKGKERLGKNLGNVYLQEGMPDQESVLSLSRTMSGRVIWAYKFTIFLFSLFLLISISVFSL